MNIRIMATTAILAASANLFSASAQDENLIGWERLTPSEVILVTVQSSTGKVTPLTTILPGVNDPFPGEGTYNSLNNTYSFKYYPTAAATPERERTLDATTGQLISDILLASPDPSNGTPSIGGLAALTPLNSSVPTGLITATTANIQMVNVGSTLTVASGGTIDMGGNRVQNVAAPIAATDAATKGYVDTSISGIHTGLNQAFKKIDQNSQGIAIAMAMSGVTLSADKRAVIGGNLGFYNGKQAVAFQAAIRMDQDVTLNGGIGFGLQDKTQVGGRVGMQVEF